MLSYRYEQKFLLHNVQPGTAVLVVEFGMILVATARALIGLYMVVQGAILVIL